jgi:hypothetical protein
MKLIQEADATGYAESGPADQNGGPDLEFRDLTLEVLCDEALPPVVSRNVSSSRSRFGSGSRSIIGTSHGRGASMRAGLRFVPPHRQWQSSTAWRSFAAQ